LSRKWSILFRLPGWAPTRTHLGSLHLRRLAPLWELRALWQWFLTGLPEVVLVLLLVPWLEASSVSSSLIFVVDLGLGPPAQGQRLELRSLSVGSLLDLLVLLHSRVGSGWPAGLLCPFASLSLAMLL